MIRNTGTQIFSRVLHITKSSRQVLLSALMLFTISIYGQGGQCSSAVLINTGTHIADGPSSGFGASGESCGVAALGPQTHADWYVFTPSIEGVYTITSTNDPALTDTRLKLWKGEGCGLLICIAGDDDNGIGFTSLITTCLSAGNTYYIEWDDRWTTSGFTWDLVLEEALGCGPPINDSCFSATSISIGSATEGVSLFATDNDPPLCGDVTEGTSGGLWYSVAGNGQNLKATTCHSGTDFDTQLSVYTGTCGSLTCLDGNDDQTGNIDSLCDVLNISENRASTVEWQSVSGVLYYIYVSGFEDNTGHFVLAVTDASGPCPLVGTTLLVTNSLDGGSGTLRQTIFDACAGDTILFDASLIGDTIILTGGEIEINKNLHIIGLGKNSLYLSGSNTVRVFLIHRERVAHLEHLTLLDGYSLLNGGSFYNLGTVSLGDIQLKNNFQGVEPKAFSNDHFVIIKRGLVNVLQ